MKYNTLINKNNILKDDYKIGKLVSVGKHFNKNEDILLEKKAAKALNKMLLNVNHKFPNIKIIPDSGYRNLEYQKKVMDYYIEHEGEEKAKKRVALPGTSEHHTGLAIDVAMVNNGIYNDNITGKEAPIIFLHNNCYKYGYILRFPKDKENITYVMSEPWHFRYVGKKLAKYLYQHNLTLEEFYINKQ